MRFRELSIRKKFLLLLVVFMVIPTCMIFAWLYKSVSDTWIEQEYNNQSNELGTILKTTELQLEDFAQIIYDIYEDQNIVGIMKEPSEDRIPLDYVKMTNYLRGIQSENGYVDSVYLFSNEGEVFFQDSTITGSYEAMYWENPQWEEAIQENNGAVTWLSTYDIQNNTKQKQYFSCGIVVKDLSSTWEPQGILVLNIDLSIFDELFALLGQQEDQKTYIICDEQGNIIWSNELKAAESLEEDFFQSLQESGEICSEQIYEGTEYVVTNFDSDYNGWHYISMKDKAQVLKSCSWVTQMVAVQILLLLLLSTLGVYMIQRYIIRPIQKMAVVMNMPEKELVGKSLQIEQEDEIGKLYESFNEMNARIKNYIEKNNEMNKREKEYQMQALNAQINPHFIYNTLDTLQWMAMDIPAPEICRLISSFSDILRYSISKKESIVTLEDEIKCLRNYINIYEERYEMAFSRFQIDERIYPYKTFKMLLQPIVENAIIHGFSHNMEEALIEIKGEIDGEEALIRICDNGAGISQERILYILSKDSDRIGLSNINQRLKLLYGEAYGL
ncbi:MAG TPA: histidine kinase, partial [Candidatus Choladousia intestinigallinarum]|nr:histidine kinase [Candidatus Choladousia intestinigallinarum]